MLHIPRFFVLQFMSTKEKPYVNISTYKFVSINDTEVLRPKYLAFCLEHNLKGTIILSEEGINMFLAGYKEDMDAFFNMFYQDSRFADIKPKFSYSDSQPFNRMLVKIKPEIITMKHPTVRPENGRAPGVLPKTLKRWLDQGHDDNGKPVVMIDTRNAFEVDVGTFDKTLDYRITKFTEFPEVIKQHKDELEDKTIVTFCTGGIRCEKAVLYMQDIGYDNVYQLDGGILKYFEEVGGDHYHGDCFVFDYRTALNPQLQETETVQCFKCRSVVTPREQLSPDYVPGKYCPHCVARNKKEDNAVSKATDKTAA